MQYLYLFIIYIYVNVNIDTLSGALKNNVPFFLHPTSREVYAHVPQMDDTGLKQLLECPLQAVLRCQQENPDANFEDLSSMALAQLLSRRSASGLEYFVLLFFICYLIVLLWNDNYFRYYRY